jgi:hypothetical protein
MAGLKREAYIDLLVGKDNEHLYSNDWFLMRGINMDALVENDRINFTYKGTIPGVTKNPTYPLTTVTRTDLPDYIALAPYSTERFQIPKIDLHALPYDKRKSILEDHRMAIMNEIVSEGIWNVSPFTTSALTPTVDATGSAGTNGNKLVTILDILNLRKKLNIVYPALKNAAWTLAMDTESYYNIANDAVIRAQQQQQSAVGDVNVKVLKIHGFELIEDGRTPYYDAATAERIVYGASPLLGTDFHSATAFVNNKTFCKAVGTVDFFDDPKDSAYQADFGSFLLHGYVGPLSFDLETNLRFMGAIIRKV